jgi:predicted metalloendopeptidase
MIHTNMFHKVFHPVYKITVFFRVLFGRVETPPRWKFCVSYVNGNLGNAVGAMFVRKFFDEQSKQDVSKESK